MHGKGKDLLENVLPYVAVASDEALNMLQAFFCTYDPRSLLILSRRQPYKDSMRVKNSQFMPNDGRGCVDWYLNMEKVRWQVDTYIAINNRFAARNGTPKRDAKSICELSRFVVDIDNAGHKPMRPWEAEKIAEAMKKFPIPVTSVIATGRGVQIHFAIQSEKHVYHYWHAYNTVSARLSAMVYFYLTHNCSFVLDNPDVLTVNSTCRLPGSFNSVAWTYVKPLYVNELHIESSNRMTLQDFMQRFDVAEPAAYDPKAKHIKKKKVQPASDAKKMEDLIDLFNSTKASYMELAKAGEVHEGNRNCTLYAFSYNLAVKMGTDPVVFKMIESAAREINNAIEEPLEEWELENIFYHAKIYSKRKKRSYCLSRQLRWAGVDYSMLYGTAIMSDEQRAKARAKSIRKYNDAKKRDRKAKRYAMIEKVYNAYKALKTISAVTNLLGVSRATVSKYIKIWKSVLEAQHEAWLAEHNSIKNSYEEDTAMPAYAEASTDMPAVMTN